MKWIFSENGRIITTIILSIITAVSAALITRFQGTIPTIIFIALTVISIILHSLFTRRCAYIDKDLGRIYGSLKEENSSYKKLLDELPIVLDRQSAGLNRIARDIERRGIIPGDRWTFDDASTEVCNSIMIFLKHYCKASVNVNYVRTVDSTGTKVKMVGCANELRDVPTTYMKEYTVTNDPTAFLDVRMFARNKLQALYKLTPEEVDKAFSYHDREKDSGRRQQILFIPVSCDKKKMIGLIEIIAPKGNIIAKTDKGMDNVRKLLTVYSSIFILLHKAEKAAIATPRRN